MAFKHLKPNQVSNRDMTPLDDKIANVLPGSLVFPTLEYFNSYQLILGPGFSVTRSILN